MGFSFTSKPFSKKSFRNIAKDLLAAAYGFVFYLLQLVNTHYFAVEHTYRVVQLQSFFKEHQHQLKARSVNTIGRCQQFMAAVKYIVPASLPKVPLRRLIPAHTIVRIYYQPYDHSNDK